MYALFFILFRIVQYVATWVLLDLIAYFLFSLESLITLKQQYLEQAPDFKDIKYPPSSFRLDDSCVDKNTKQVCALKLTASYFLKCFVKLAQVVI